jgi:hypothetical protein
VVLTSLSLHVQPTPRSVVHETSAGGDSQNNRAETPQSRSNSHTCYFLATDKHMAQLFNK